MSTMIRSMTILPEQLNQLDQVPEAEPVPTQNTNVQGSQVLLRC